MQWQGSEPNSLNSINLHFFLSQYSPAENSKNLSPSILFHFECLFFLLLIK